MGMAGNQIPPQVAAQMAQSGASGSGGKVNPQSNSGFGMPPEIAARLQQQAGQANSQAAQPYSYSETMNRQLPQGGSPPAFGQPVQSSQAMFDPNAGMQQSNDPRMGAINPNAGQINQADFQNWLKNQPAGSTSGRFMPQGGATYPNNRPSGITLDSRGGTFNPGGSSGFGMPPEIAARLQQQAGQQGGMSGKGGQSMPSPQGLAQGLQQQAAIQQAAGQLGKGGRAMPSPQGQIPMSMQRQPQGGLAGRTMTPQVQNAAKAVMGSFRGY